MSSYHAQPAYGLTPSQDFSSMRDSRYVSALERPYPQQTQNSFMLGDLQTEHMDPLERSSNGNVHQGVASNYANGSFLPPFANYHGGLVPQNVSQHPPGPVGRDFPQLSSNRPFLPFRASHVAMGSHESAHVGASNLPFPAIATSIAEAKEKPGEAGLEDGEISDPEANSNLNIAKTNLATPIRASQEPGMTRNTAPETPSGATEGPRTLSSSQIMGEALKSKTNFVCKNKLEVTTKSVLSARDQSHNILRELSSYSITFQDLASEGLNPEILRQIYDDIGIEVNPCDSSKQRKESPSQLRASVENEQVKNVHSPHYELSENTNVISGRSQNDVDGKVRPSNSVGATNPEAMPTPETEINDSIVLAWPVAKNSKSSHLTPLAKAVNKDPQTKTLERKEYIARMLAAKNNKSIPTSSAVSNPIKKPSGPKFVSQTLTAKSNSSVIPGQPELLDIPGEKDQTYKNASAIEAKRKAQTELARMKFEALVAQKNPQRDELSAIKRGKPMSRPPPKSVTALLPAPADPAPQNCNENVASVSVLPRQDSYFSPVSQTPAFSIPGLFMASKSLDQWRVPSSIDTDSEALSSHQRVGIASEAAIVTDPPLLNLESEREPSSSEAAIPTLINSQSVFKKLDDTGFRKRQKAAEFIDSPSTRVRRSLGRSADASVIIDISEDESEASDDFDTQTGNDDQKVPPIEHMKFVVVDRGKLNPRAPLTDSATRAGPAQDLEITTPPVPYTPSRFQEPKGLKSKELEIESMNRKIAELEQRIKTKQVASRTQSPGLPTQAVWTQTSTESVSNHSESPRVTGSIMVGGKNVVEEAKSGSSSATLNKHLELATKEQLFAEKARQEHFLAVTEVEAEQSRESYANDSRPSRAIDGSIKRSYDCQDVEAVDDISTSQEEQQNFSIQRHSSRKSEIESGLPLLDAEIDKTQSKLQSLKVQIAKLEAEYQKGVEGREALLSELRRLSKTTALLEPNGRSTTTSSQDRTFEQLMESDERRSPLQLQLNTCPSTLNMEESKRSPSPDGDFHSSPLQGEGTCENAADQDESADHLSTHTPLQVSSKSPDGELPGAMVVSGSDGHGDDSVEDGPTNAEENERSQVDDDEEVYEPPNNIRLSQEISVSPSESRLQDAPQFTLTDSNTGPDTEIISDKAHLTALVSEEVLGNGEPQVISTHATSSLKGSDDGEYESPEPHSLTQDNGQSKSNPTAHIPSGEAPSNSGIHEPDPSDAKNSQDDHAEAKKKRSYLRNGLFTPYESPLKQFKTYRYQPDLPSKVQRGYRSLTYFNDINSETPLCHYEIDGTCNDAACTYQHFANMELRDDTILFHLGQPPEGVVKRQYAEGLTKIIRDLRDGKVKDFNTIASEIIRYRAKALGNCVEIRALSESTTKDPKLPTF